MERKNCWEIEKCGREPGGENEEEFGVCPVVEEKKYNGVNKGVNGGRFCWSVTGTFCGGKPQRQDDEKITNCLECDFFKQVNHEEGRFFILSQSDLNK